MIRMVRVRGMAALIATRKSVRWLPPKEPFWSIYFPYVRGRSTR
jgi:hypothetical protein